MVLFLGLVLFAAMPGRGEVHVHGRVPRVFEANRGQAPEGILFLSRTAEGNLLLARDEAILVVHPPAPSREDALDPERWARRAAEPSRPEVIRMRLAGADEPQFIETLDPLPGDTVYSGGVTAPHFAGVRYRGVYPGIDLVFRAGRGAFEHDFLVAPGADPARIRIRFEGASSVSIDSGGDLVLRLENAVVRHRRPVIYQEIGGVRRPVEGGFRWNGEEATFHLGAYDRAHTLVIDPLVNSTRLGSAAGDFLSSAARNANGIVACGAFGSLDLPDGYPNPGGPYGGGLYDAVVFFLSNDLTTLRRMHVLRGNGDDRCFRVAFRPDGGAYAAGVTGSTNLIASAGANQMSSQGMNDMWLAGYGADGSQQFFTYNGGSQDDILFSLVVDSGGNAAIGGWTISPNYPTTAGSYNQNALGGSDGAVTRFGSSGLLLQSTRLGSNGNDIITALALAPDGSIGFTGLTTGTNLPTNANAPQRARQGTQDALVGALAGNLSTLRQISYFGAGGVETARSLSIHANAAGGFHYTIAGTTDSPTGFGGQYGGGIDGFAAAIAWPLSGVPEVVWSRYFGGGGTDNLITFTERRGPSDLPLAFNFYGNTNSTLVNRILNACGGGTAAQAWVVRYAPGTGETAQGCIGPGTIDDARASSDFFSDDVVSASFDPEAVLVGEPGVFDPSPNGARDGALLVVRSPVADVLPRGGSVLVTQSSHASKFFSGAGSVHVNAARLLRQTGAPNGYFNLVSGTGWNVRNIFIDAQHDIEWLSKDFALSTTIPNDEPGPGTRISTVSVNISVTPQPMTAAPAFDPSSSTVFPVGQQTIATCGAGAPDDGVPAPPMNPPFSSTGATYSYVQPYSVLNVQTAHNQCVPMAFANSLAWLDAMHGDVTLPNRHEPGLLDDTLVGRLERLMQRQAPNRNSGNGVGFEAAMRGKFEYLDQNRITRMFVHRHQGTSQGTGGTPVAGVSTDFSAFGQITRNEGNRVDFTWLCRQIQDGEDVEVVYEVPPSNPRVPLRNSHMVRVIGCGETAGARWIQIIQDRKQGSEETGNSDLEVKHVWLHDFDGDGNLNNDSDRTEVLYAVAESFTDEMKRAPGAAAQTVRAAVVNGGSFAPRAVAPGSFTAVFGLFPFLDQLLGGQKAAPGRAAIAIPGVRVLVNGRESPILSAVSSQINVQLPAETEPGEATLVIEHQGRRSIAVGIPVAATSPGIFLIDPAVAGAGRGAVQNQDFSLNVPDRPARPGEVIVIYVAGMGRMTPVQKTGEPAPAAELVRAAGNVTAKLGGADATVQFAGLTPGFLALEQVNLFVPDLPPGEHDLEIAVDGVVSNRVKVSVGAR